MEKIETQSLSGKVTSEWAACWAEQWEWWRKYIMMTPFERSRVRHLFLPCKYCHLPKCNIKNRKGRHKGSDGNTV